VAWAFVRQVRSKRKGLLGRSTFGGGSGRMSLERLVSGRRGGACWVGDERSRSWDRLIRFVVCEMSSCKVQVEVQCCSIRMDGLDPMWG